MRTSTRLAAVACIGAAAIALNGCSLIDPAEPDTAPAESAAVPSPSEPEPTSADTAACDPSFDAAADDVAMEPLVGEWVSEEQSIFGAEYPETSTLCIEADGSVTYEAPQGIWEGHLTLGDESANQIVLDPAEGDDAEGYLVDLNYDADEETIGLVESGDDGRWFTYART